MPDVVDLRSDTVTRPTEGMRRAMASADVGDDVYGEDPTVNRLQDEVAGRFGREAALFVPSGIMANQIWLRLLAAPGTEVITESSSHLVAYEAGSGAALAGVQFRTIDGDRGRLDARRVEAALRPRGFPYTENSLVAVEQTTNRGGGAVHDLPTLEALRDLTRQRGLRFYLDGARIFNAVVATGTAPAVYGGLVDGLSFCVSKALGAPVGSLLVGDADAIEHATLWRRRYGGAMRQVGILAAAGLHALEHHVDRLAEDHANARRIATIVAEDHPEAVDVHTVDTNMVYVRTGGRPAVQVVDSLASCGVLVGAMGEHLLRLVTHLDVDAAGAQRAGRLVADHLGGAPR